MKRQMKNISIILPFTCLIAIFCLFNQGTGAEGFSRASHSQIANTMRYSRLVTKFSDPHREIMFKKVLQSKVSKWDTFHGQGHTNGVVDGVTMPEDDSGANVLKVALLAGQPYAGLHAYRNLLPAGNATAFHMHTRFFFPVKEPIQALEFTMNKWTKDTRWEWALQWQALSESSAQSWRVWDGASWVEMHQQQVLSANTWHTLDLYGSVVKGQVHYQWFQCDDKRVNMQHYTYATLLPNEDHAAVGVQIDGDSTQQPYNVYFDQLNLESR